MTQPKDLFELIAMQAAGLPIPPPPDIPGRVFLQKVDLHDERDSFADAWLHRQSEGGNWLKSRSGRTY